MGRFAKLKQKPFILTTSLLAMTGWSVAFGGACMLKILNGAWWVIIYQFFITTGNIAVFSSGSIAHYRLAMMTFLASSIPLLTIQVDYVIQYNRPTIPKLPATIYVAGYIILLIVQYMWVLVLGSGPKTTLGKLGYTAEETHMDYTEKAEPAKTQLYGNHIIKFPNPVHNSTISLDTTGTHKPSGPVEYTEKVQALHSYKASLADPNELSFEKGETLEIVDRRGNWWQARNSNGATGIIPSNYFG